MSEELATQSSSTDLATSNGHAERTKWLRPRYDARQLDGGDYELRVWMPGVSKKGVHVSLDKDILTVTGTCESYREEGWRPVIRELPDGDYRLSLTLNMKIDGSRISAHVENGVLTLDLPIVEAAKPREITIE